jgi:hypothetical protein
VAFQLSDSSLRNFISKSSRFFGPI